MLSVGSLSVLPGVSCELYLLSESSAQERGTNLIISYSHQWMRSDTGKLIYSTWYLVGECYLFLHIYLATGPLQWVHRVFHEVPLWKLSGQCEYNVIYGHYEQRPFCFISLCILTGKYEHNTSGNLTPFRQQKTISKCVRNWEQSNLKIRSCV